MGLKLIRFINAMKPRRHTGCTRSPKPDAELLAHLNATVALNYRGLQVAIESPTPPRIIR